MSLGGGGGGNSANIAEKKNTSWRLEDTCESEGLSDTLSQWRYPPQHTWPANDLLDTPSKKVKNGSGKGSLICPKTLADKEFTFSKSLKALMACVASGVPAVVLFTMFWRGNSRVFVKFRHTHTQNVVWSRIQIKLGAKKNSNVTHLRFGTVVM